MYVTLVNVHVKPENVADFVAASRENHEAAIHEPGNLRFDVLQRADNPCRFILYEAYETEEHAAAHKSTAHYVKWKETVADWMASPRFGVVYQGLAP